MSDLVLEFSNVSKKFKTDFWKKPYPALQDVSFSVPTNSICGLIGPNGAGKTTAIKVIFGFIHADQGTVKIFGKDHRDKNTHQSLGYLPEAAYYYDYLRPVEFLDFYARLFNIPSHERARRIDELLDLVGLSDKKQFRLRNFSKGMLQRIGIAQALINDPSFVVLDEPMSGLDPLGRKEVRDIILHLKEKGKTVLFSTHILPDVENLSDHVVMVVKGQVKASGAVGQLIRPDIRSYDVLVESSNVPALPNGWKEQVQIRHFQRQTMLRFTKAELVQPDEIFQWLQANKVPLVSFVPHKESLEDLLVRNVEKS